MTALEQETQTPFKFAYSNKLIFSWCFCQNLQILLKDSFSAIFICKTYNVSFSLRNATCVSSDVIFLPNALLYVVNLPRGVRTPNCISQGHGFECR